MKIRYLLFVIGLLITLVSCGGAEERKAAYLEKAIHSLEINDLDKARIDLRNVLQIDPKHAQAYFLSGKIHEIKSDYRKSFIMYTKAAELDPENPEYLAKLGTFYLTLVGDTDKATEIMGEILNKNSDDINGLLLKARILFKQDNTEEALVITKGIYNNHPRNIENVIFLSALHAKNKKHSEAIKILDKAYESNPNNSRLAEKFAANLFENEEYDRVEVVLKQLLDKHPESFSNYINLARFYQSINKPEKIEKLLKEAVKANPEDAQRQIAYAKFYKDTEGNAKARAVLTDLIKQYPENGTLRLAIAQIYVEEENFDAASKIYKKAINDFSEEETGITSRLQLAAVAMTNEDIESASTFVDEALAIVPNDATVNFLNAKIALIKRDSQQAIISLRTVIKDNPENIEAYFLLAKAHKLSGEHEQADSAIQNAYDNNRTNLKVLPKLSQYHLKNNNIIQAEKIIDGHLSVDKDSYEALVIKAAILLRQDRRKEAKDIIKGIYSKDPNNIENILLLSSLYTQNKEFSEAIRILDKALMDDPDNERLTGILAKSLMGSKDYDRAEELLKKLLNKHPESFNNYLNLARFYQRINKPGKAQEFLKEAIKANPDDAQRQFAYAKFFKDTEGNAKAKTVLIDLIKQYPENGSLRLAISQIYIEEKSFDAAARTYKKAINDFPKEKTGIASRLQLATIDMRNEDVSSAEALVDEALAIVPNDADANFMKGKIAVVKKESQQAIISLRTVIKEAPGNIEAYLLLAKSYKLNGENDRVDDVIENAYDNNRTNRKALLELSQYHLKNNNAIQAEKIIDSYLSIDKNSYEALTIKAGILTTAKRYSDAKQYVARTLLLYPEKESGYLYSAISLIANNKQDEALAVLEKGYQKSSHGKRILSALTKHNISRKQYDNAIKRIKGAINENDDNAGLYMALSEVYVQSGNVKEAEKNLKHVIKIKPKVSQPYTLLSKIYIKQDQKEKARLVLNDGLNNIKNDFSILLSLAGLYEMDRNYDSAIKTYEDILKIHADKVVAINNLAALLSDHRKDAVSLNRAKELADMIKNVKEPVILDTVGWVYYKTGNYADAVSTLKSVVEGAPNIPIFNYHLGMAYQKINDNESAKNFLSKALKDDSDFPGRSEAERLLKTL